MPRRWFLSLPRLSPPGGSDAAYDPARRSRTLTIARLEIDALDAAPRSGKPQWAGVINRYQKTVLWKAIAQMATTFVPLAVLFYLMYRSLALPYIVTLLLSIPAAGLLVR